MNRQGRLAHFVPLDVSEQTLRDAAREIHLQFDVAVTGVVGNFRSHLGALPKGGRRLICFLGGTVGNLDPPARAQFLADLRATMASSDSLLLGTDLVKDPARLVAAYDDASGVTAQFNKNVLGVLNRELGAEFDLVSFSHVALWNASDSCIEMRLRSAREQSVRISALERTLHLSEGQEILTEISVKFTEHAVAEALAAADLTVEKSFTDAAGQFLLTLAHPRT
jgi:L-histidine Nalpha-methyltransferase